VRLPRVLGRLGVLTYVVTQAMLLFWWVGFYPGTMSYDTVTYVWQVSTGNWNTQHSVLYDALVWLSLVVTGQLGLLTLAQTVVAAAGLAYAVTGLHRLRVPGRWLLIAAVAAVSLPAVGTFTVYASKDVAFALAEIWLLGTVARILADRPHPSRRQWFALAAELAALALFRQNGFAVVVLTAAVLAAVLAGLRWRVLAGAGAALLLAILANFALYPLLGVRPVGSELLYGPAYADIAVAYADRPADFTAADLRLMSTVATLRYWQHSANCYNADSTVPAGGGQFDLAAARTHATELAALWLRLVKRMPDEIVSARLCRGSIAWNPFPAPAAGRTVKVPIAGARTYFDFPAGVIAQSPYAGAIRLSPLLPPVHEVGQFLRRLSDTRDFEWFAWRGATWCYIGYAAVLLLARRRHDLALLGLVAVILANQLNVLASNPGQLMRYMAGPIILGILLLPLAFVTGGPRRAAVTNPTVGPPPEERSRADASA
jgi:hypothetical protein